MKIMVGILIGLSLQAGATYASHTLDHLFSESGRDSWEQRDRNDRMQRDSEERRHNQEMERRQSRDC